MTSQPTKCSLRALTAIVIAPRPARQSRARGARRHERDTAHSRYMRLHRRVSHVPLLVPGTRVDTDRLAQCASANPVSGSRMHLPAHK